MLEFKISAETAAELAEKLRGVAALLSGGAITRFFYHPESGSLFMTEDGSRPSEPLLEEVDEATFRQLRDREKAPAPVPAPAAEEAPRRTRRSRSKTEEAPAAPEVDPPTAGTSAAPTADTPPSPPSPTSGEDKTAEAAPAATSSAPTASSPATSAEPDEPAASFEDVNRLARELLAKHPDRAAAVQQVVKEVTGTAGKIATITPDQYGAAIAAFERALADLDV